MAALTGSFVGAAFALRSCMFKRCASAALIGVEAVSITAEAHRGRGIPGTHLVGLARGAVRESLTRVKAAIASSGFLLATDKVVINLLPAEFPKSESALDLALAMALLAVNELVPAAALERRRFFGELSLNGEVCSVRGVSLVADLSRRCGDLELIVSSANADEACISPDLRVIAIDSLATLVCYLRGELVLTAHVASPPPLQLRPSGGCLSEVYGQARAKRALEIAAAGSHNMLMIGPPGSGKTMLARRLPSIMPPLTPDERLEVMRIHSACGLRVDGARPFRSPHHTASDIALCGGGSPPHPGEISLAHNGVLFLDELPEFSRKALEALREPLEDGVIHVSRASMALTFPAQALFVAAMNPCPCGHFREAPTTFAAGIPNEQPQRVCLCGFEAVRRYRSRISGPLLDRIDLHVMVDLVPYRALASRAPGEASEVVRDRVAAAHARQHDRFGKSNAVMTQSDVQRHIRLDARAMSVIEKAVDRYGLSTRAITRALKVARTIADLEKSDDVSEPHVDEAIALRVLDRDAQAMVMVLSA